MSEMFTEPTPEEKEKIKASYYNTLREELEKLLHSQKRADRFLEVMDMPAILDLFEDIYLHQTIESCIHDMIEGAVSRLTGPDPEDSDQEPWSWDGSLWEFVDAVQWSCVCLKMYKDGCQNLSDVVSNSKLWQEQATKYGMTDGAVIREMLRLGSEALRHLDADDMRKKIAVAKCDDNGEVYLEIQNEE